MFIWAENSQIIIETKHVFQSKPFFISVALFTQVASAPLMLIFFYMAAVRGDTLSLLYITSKRAR